MHFARYAGDVLSDKLVTNWFQTFFIFTPILGEMIQIDLRIFFNWVGSTTNYMGVSKNRGTPKWMVYKGKPY